MKKDKFENRLLCLAGQTAKQDKVVLFRLGVNSQGQQKAIPIMTVDKEFIFNFKNGIPINNTSIFSGYEKEDLYVQYQGKDFLVHKAN